MKNLLFTLSILLFGFAAQAQNSCWVKITEASAPDPTTPVALVAEHDNTQHAQFHWSTGATTDRIYPNAAGDYCVTATFSNGCVATECYHYTGGSGGANCDVSITATPLNTGGAILKATMLSPTAAMHYAWSTGETTQTITILAPGNYCVTATSSNTCFDSDCYAYAGSSYALSVLVSANPAQAATLAEVFLVKYDTAQGGTLTAIDTVQTSANGFAHFSSIPNGKYLVKAALLPNSPGYTQFLPTYYESALFWDSGTYVHVPHDPASPNVATAISIQMIPGTNPGGPGFIGGRVIEGANFNGSIVDDRSEGDPIAGVSVVLETLDGQAVASTLTDASGAYAFDNLAYGSYKISIDIINIPVASAVVTLSPDAPAVKELTFKADDDSAVLPAPEAPFGPRLVLWPNPVAADLNLKLPAQESTLALRDALGKVVYQAVVHGEQATLPMSHLAQGAYWLSVRSGNVITTQKVWKQ